MKLAYDRGFSLLSGGRCVGAKEQTGSLVCSLLRGEKARSSPDASGLLGTHEMKDPGIIKKADHSTIDASIAEWLPQMP